MNFASAPHRSASHVTDLKSHCDQTLSWPNPMKAMRFPLRAAGSAGSGSFLAPWFHSFSEMTPFS